MTRRLFTDSGRKRIVKNRGGRKEENDNKQKSNTKKKDDHFFYLSSRRKKKKTFSLFVGSSATPGTKFNQACHTALLMFRRSEMSSVGSSVIPVSYATSRKLFFFKLLLWKKYIFYVSEMAVGICTSPPCSVFLSLPLSTAFFASLSCIFLTFGIWELYLFFFLPEEKGSVTRNTMHT